MGTDFATQTAAVAKDQPRVLALWERLERITVCTRPFRAFGPRVEAEQTGGKLLVHHYGHGGAGWSLSWGTAEEAAALVMQAGCGPVAVVGCGAIGLTTAVVLQRRGIPVQLYARDLPSATRSARATGLWSPDSRVALAGAVDADFAPRWERLARHSWAAFANLLDAPGRPVQPHARYVLSARPPEEEMRARHAEDPVGFAHLDSRLADLYPPPVDRPGREEGFCAAHCRTVGALRFDIPALARLLEEEFRARGGVLRQKNFPTAAEMLQLPEPTIVNCTGWASRQLFDDTTLIPVRGQIAWLPREPAVAYSLQWGKLSMVSRPDGVVVQLGAASDDTGWNDADETPDRTEAERALQMLAEVQGQAATTA